MKENREKQNEKNNNDINNEIQVGCMTKYKKYGRMWYTTKREAENARRSDEVICRDDGERAYFLKKIKKPFWRF